jgi:hypothetical protein
MVEDAPPLDLVRAETEAALEAQLANGRSLLTAFHAAAPRSVADGAGARSWPALALGLIHRAAYALESGLMIPDRTVDAAVLARVTLEHAVTLAWLGVAPEKHIPRLLRTELDQGRALVAGFKRYEPKARKGGTTEAALDEIEPHAAPQDQGMPGVEKRATASDRFWLSRVAAYVPLHPRYETLYRFYSSVTHPSVLGARVFLQRRDGAVHSRRPEMKYHTQAAASAVLAFGSGLIVMHSCFGWPPLFETLETLTRGQSGQPWWEKDDLK